MKLSRQASVLWAKKRSEDGQAYWLPLIAHLTDTKNVINWLFNHWLSTGQKRILSGNLSEVETQKLVKLVGFLHDIGKATPAFQLKKSRNSDDLMDSELKSRITEKGFKDFYECQLHSAAKSPHALAGEAIVKKYGVPESVGAIIGGHHGKTTKEHDVNIQLSRKRGHPENYYQNDDDPEIRVQWESVQEELFDYGLAEAGYHSTDEIPDILEPQAVILEGLLIMADWLSSGEYLDDKKEEPLFPLVGLDTTWEDIEKDERFRFEDAMLAWLKFDEWIPQQVIIKTEEEDFTKLDPYKKRWQFNARPVQRKMTEAIDATVDPGIIIIEAPMGLGKTEIALVATEQLAWKTGRDGLFIGLPTQATTNAMFSRVKEWLAQLAGEQRAKFATGLLQGRKQFNTEFMQLPKAEDIYDDDDVNSAVAVDDWFSGKKSILTKFTVGTIDNLLVMGLRKKHLFLQHLGMSGKVVVIDEAHAFDAFMNAYLYRAMEWLGAYHVPVIVLSATLPKEKRKQLLDAYARGKYGEHYDKSLTAPEGWSETQAYPLMSILDGSEIKQVKTFPGHSDQKPLEVTINRLNVPDEQLISHVLDQLANGGIAGVIVNTVRRAQTLAKLVPDDVKKIVLHSAFLATDRAAKETILQQMIGKKGQRPDKMIVIGTQVLEQSLDIDFDVLYTDIAPIDLVLQRIGRLHRHELPRPKKLSQPKVFVTGIQAFGEYGDGNPRIYDQYLLMKTDYFLKDTITLPSDISSLVQLVYDASTDSQIEGIGVARKEFDAKLKSKESRAKTFQVDDPSFEEGKTIHGWLNLLRQNADRNEQAMNAAVRDIKETLEVILIQHTNHGDFLLDGRRLGEVSSKEIAQQIIRLPHTITPFPSAVVKAIDKLEEVTRTNFSEWQDDVWLRGALALLLNQDSSVTFMDWTLSYSTEFGLEYVKEDGHESADI